MNHQTDRKTKLKIRLGQHDFQRIQAARTGTTLVCDTGVLWVTQAGDLSDYVLLPGDKLTVSGRGRVVIEAMREADLLIG